MRKLLALLCLWPGLAHAQGIDPTVAPATVFPNIDGTELQVHLEPTQIFFDDFTNTGNVLDTTNRWNAIATGSGGTSSATAGTMTLNSNTTAGGFVYITTQPAFTTPSPGYLGVQHAINIESPVLTNTFRFWGVGNPQTTPTAAAPLVDAVGFAIGTNGHLFATSWAGGTAAFNLDLSVPNQGQYLAPTAGQKFDAGVHRYQIAYRGDYILWFVDGQLVARVPNGSAGPNTNTLPAIMLIVNNTTPPTVNPTFQNGAVLIGDSGRNSAALKDGTFGWRKATITAGGAIITSLAAPAAGTAGAGYPLGATAITASATGTTAATATLTAAAGKFTYLCGFQATYTGATAAGAGTVTASNTVTGSLNYVSSQGTVANGNQMPLIVSFSPCVQSSAVNTTIPVAATLGAGTTNTAVTATGYQQ